MKLYSPVFSRPFRLSAIAALNLAAVLALHAESVLIEDFEKASDIENVSAVEGTAIWTSRGDRQFLSVVKDEEGLKAGNALRMIKGLVYVTFPEVTLEEGDSLELSFRYRFAQAPQEAGFPLRIGIYKDDNGDPVSGNSPGYWFMSCPGVENGNAMIILEEGTDGALGGGKDIPMLQPMFQGPASGTVPNKVKLTVTRNSADTVDVTSQVNEDSPNTRTDTTGKISQFNAFAISLATDGETDFLMDDVTLTVTRKAK
jgi:hypothetical protein